MLLLFLAKDFFFFFAPVNINDDVLFFLSIEVNSKVQVSL